MANPISIRPWSRLASLRSSPAPDSLPKPQPAEISLKTTNSSSHDEKKGATKSTPTTPDVHSPMPSQKLKLTTPMTFPPSKLKSQAQLEISIALEEVTKEKPNGNRDGSSSLKNESVENQAIGHNEKEVTTKGKDKQAMLSASDGCGMRVITISGENKGAYMQITKPHKKPIHKMRAVCTNSNVQCVNNSIVLNTSLTHHDPGMHLFIPKKSFGEGFHLKERCEVQRN